MHACMQQVVTSGGARLSREQRIVLYVTNVFLMTEPAVKLNITTTAIFCELLLLQVLSYCRSKLSCCLRRGSLTSRTRSMSDLAPFVAAALRDKACNDLLEENRALQKTQTEARTVEITGPDGTPVFAKGMIHEGEYQSGGERWSVKMTQQVECSLESLCEVEIRLGRTPLVGLSVVDNSQYCPLDFIIGSFQENGMGLFSVSIEPNQCLSVQDLTFDVGPFESYEEYRGLRQTKKIISWGLS